jgi:hypothetical protein
MITVGRSKTAAGTGRTIPMSGELRSILETYKNGYEEKVGTVEPEAYVFPYGKSRKWDRTRLVNSLKTAWENVRAWAGVTCRLRDLSYIPVLRIYVSPVRRNRR